MAEPIHNALGDFLNRRGADRQFRLVRLWQNWAMVLGDDLAEFAIPLGHKGKTLIVGAEDNMAQQELAYYTYDILERVNAFIDEDFFDKVRVELVMGNAPLDELRFPVIERKKQAVPPRPRNLGKLLGKLDPESPVTKAYEQYVRMFDDDGPDK